LPFTLSKVPCLAPCCCGPDQLLTCKLVLWLLLLTFVRCCCVWSCRFAGVHTPCCLLYNRTLCCSLCVFAYILNVRMCELASRILQLFHLHCHCPGLAAGPYCCAEQTVASGRGWRQPVLVAGCSTAPCRPLATTPSPVLCFLLCCVGHTKVRVGSNVVSGLRACVVYIIQHLSCKQVSNVTRLLHTRLGTHAKFFQSCVRVLAGVGSSAGRGLWSWCMLRRRCSASGCCVMCIF
jgi:hypothetical protein